MVFNNCASEKTDYHWRVIGGRTAFILQLSVFLWSIITLIVTIVVNVTVANDPYNDYGEGFGWALMMPGPSIVFVWSAVCMALCRFAVLSVVMTISFYIIATLGLIAEGVWTILAYDWEPAALVPAPFMFISAINCLVVFIYAVRAHRGRGRQRLGSKENIVAP